MTRFRRRWAVLFAALAMLLVVHVPAHAQGGGVTASISGVVVDTSGAVLPGADVKVVNDATQEEFHAVTGARGTFNVPSLEPGTYSVTIAIMGFKTRVLRDVVLNAGVPASVRPEMEVGGLEETVEVRGGSEIVQTQTAAVSTTIDVNQISNLPLTSRSVLDFVANLPGVNTPSGTRQSTVNGLPRSTINITIDGMSAQDNHLKTGDGFFARVSPRLDAIEEVTVSSAAAGAEATGQGAVQIRFVTRSGSNVFTGSGYYYLQHHSLNANTWFNNRDLTPDPATGKAPKADNVLHQPGGRFGGPIVIPGLFDGRNRAFFFVNYEESRSPGQITRTRNILHPRAQAGVFRYLAGGQVREVDLLSLAAANGQVATMDPTVARVLADIRSATSGGTVTALNRPDLEQFQWQLPRRGFTKYPTTRVDVNLGQRHRLSGSVNYTDLLSSPDTLNGRDPLFPGFTAGGNQHSDRYTVQGTLRSTLTSNLVNELRIGRTGGATLFTPEVGPEWFSGGFPDQGGYWLGLSAADISNASSSANYSAREAGTRLVENTLSWMRGSHSISMGGSYTRAVVWLENIRHVPHMSFGVVNGDPAASMFGSANFPGASNAQLGDAQNLYAVLTGRISAINAITRLDEATDEYVYLGRSMQRARLDDWGFHISDTWRVRPNFTLNLGLRYELQMPFTALNNSYSTTTIDDVCGVSGAAGAGTCNLFQPGVMPGKSPEFQQFTKGQHAYNVDRNNFAPSVGVNWVPSARSGIFRTLLGAEGDSSLRAGYSLAYTRPGMSDFTGLYNANPGVAITTNRNLSNGNLNQDGLGFPVLLRNTSRLGPPDDLPGTQVYPMRPIVTGSVNMYDPDLQVPYSQTWTGGWQRKLTRDMVGEIRYVGTRHLQGWIDYNFNEINIVENGFLDEFRQAQANLQANLAAGRGPTFAFTGVPGTAPLPIFLAYFTGRNAALAGNPASYTGSLWSNNTFVNPLAIFNPNPHAAANALDAAAGRRQNALNAGLPANFLVTNPEALGNARVRANGGYTKFHGLQAEVRKRLSHGLQFQASYSYGRTYESARYSFRTPRVTRLDAGSPGNVTHAFKANWVFELPFGEGRRFGGNAGRTLDRLIGGWSLDGVARIQSGPLVNFGNVRLVGMTEDDFRKAYTLRFDHANRLIFMLPEDIIENTRRAFDVSATSPTGYGSDGPPQGRYLAPANGPDCIEIAPGFGDCGINRLIVPGPRQVRFDLSAVKRTRIVGRVIGEFRAEMINAFNHPTFSPVSSTSTNLDNHRVTGVLPNSSRTLQLVWRVSF